MTEILDDLLVRLAAHQVLPSLQRTVDLVLAQFSQVSRPERRAHAVEALMADYDPVVYAFPHSRLEMPLLLAHGNTGLSLRRVGEDVCGRFTTEFRKGSFRIGLDGHLLDFEEIPSTQSAYPVRSERAKLRLVDALLRRAHRSGEKVRGLRPPSR